MSYQVKSYMLVGMPYNDTSFVETAVTWLKEAESGFKEEYENMVKVVELMPRYKSDLEALNQVALDAFYGYLEDRNVVRIEEHRGLSYIGFSIDDTVSINDKSLNQFCLTVKEKSDELYDLLGKKGGLLSVHDYS